MRACVCVCVCVCVCCDQVLEEFRSGRVNTLIATSVAEEGLDIGSVDLIVCYDVQPSSLRMVQRMGRTGRKHQGKVVVLLVPGIEDKVSDLWAFLCQFPSFIIFFHSRF